MKILKLFFLASATAATLQACQKSGLADHTPATTVTTEAVDATVKEGVEYTYTLPSGTNYKITTQAANASSSQISTDATGTPVFHYVPAAGYTGTDEVTITGDTTGTGGQHGCNKGGKEHGGDKTVHQYNFNISVVANSVSS